MGRVSKLLYPNEKVPERGHVILYPNEPNLAKSERAEKWS